jgi:replication factor C subunit 3/5
MNLPYVEKYRPQQMKDIISHPEIIRTLTNLIANNKLPHMIFYGPPGTGKTTTILSCAKMIYGSNYRSMILELNGSDDRGINVVRESIKNFSATNSMISLLSENEDIETQYFIRTKIKLVILDEADAMTYDAQFALRRVIELYTDTTRFCLICNYLTKIIPALQSRCQMFRFAPINVQDHLCKLDMIIENEKINVDRITREKIIEYSEGDMRKSLNLLQSLNMSKPKDSCITLETMYKLIGYSADDIKRTIIEEIKDKSLIDIYRILRKIVIDKNITNSDLIKEITSYYGSCDIDHMNNTKLCDMFDELAKIEVNLVNNVNNNIHLMAISSILYKYNID